MNPLPESDPVTAVLDQLEYIVIEAEALAPLLATLPIEVLRTRLFDEDSILEAFARLALRDREYHLSMMSAIADNENPAIVSFRMDESPKASDVTQVMLDVAVARKQLLEYLRSLPDSAWNRTGDRNDRPVSLTEIAYEIAHGDAALLKKLTERLHSARLSDRH